MPTTRSGRGWSPASRAVSATSTSPRKRRPRRSRRGAERWPREGVPPNPGGWLPPPRPARRSTGSVASRARRQAPGGPDGVRRHPSEPTGPVEDDRLRLVFTCCHPALAMEARVALTLRLLGGLTVAEIARAFWCRRPRWRGGSPAPRRRSRRRTFPTGCPSADDIRERLAGVLAVVYLVFNEGYLPARGTTRARRPHRRGDPPRPPAPELLPDDGEVAGLLALMLLTDARRAARVSRTGELVTLDEQDRGAWDRALIAEGTAWSASGSRVAAGGDPPGRYQLLAAINAVHTGAARPRHRLVRDRRPLRPAGADRPLADRAAQPGGRGRRGRRPRGRARRDRPARRGPRRLPRLPRRARRPAAAARAQRRVAGGVRPGHRARRQPGGAAYLTRRRDQLPQR